MELLVKRKWYTDVTTIGELYVDGEFFCYTLEDPARAEGEKVYAQTCIPAGQYPLVLDYSPSFKRIMPCILNVPMFTGILIHWGNKAEDTAGCLLVGETRAKDWISSSKKVFNKLYPLIEDAIARGQKVSITYENCANEITS